MKPNFSFLYNGTRMTAADMSEGVCTLEAGITVTLKQTVYEEYNATEWVLWFENTTDKNSGIFSRIFDCDCLLPLALPAQKDPGYMPKEGDPCVIAMKGCIDGNLYWECDEQSATEFSVTNDYLDRARRPYREYANGDGRSSDGMMPFFDVTALGCGYIAAIGWSGGWKASFSCTDKGVEVKTGLKETNFYLEPGEKIRTTAVLIMQYEKGEDKHNKFRRLIKNHFSHTSYTPAESEGLMAYELWGGLPTHEMVKRLRELKQHDIRFDQIWLDAGWYGDCLKCDETFTGDWSDKTGNWTVNMRFHPDGLLEVAEAARDAGAKMMLWIEPERAIVGTEITKTHPEWLMTRTGDKSRILNFGMPEVRKYVVDLLSHYIETLGMGCYRQDSNAGLTDYFCGNDTPDRRGITEIKHILGLYEVWDTILFKYPGLLIDNCASGGRRIDIEAMRRSVIFFRSDYQCNFNENPEVLQTHNAGIARYIPLNGCTSKTKSDTYAIRSSYSASWGGAFYNTVFQTMDENDFAWASRITKEYRSIRRYFSEDFYNHASSVLDPTAWAVWQYHDPKTQKGILMAFRRSESPFAELTVEMKGLVSGKTYTCRNLDTEEACEFTDTLTVKLPEKRSCVIFEYAMK